MRAEMDTAMRAAARTFQVWQLPPLLRAAFENSADDQWLLDIVQASRAPGQLLGTLSGFGPSRTWLSERQQKLVLESAVNVLSAATAANRFEYQQMRQKYLEYLLDHKEASAARQVLDSLTDAEKRWPVAQQAEIRLAALENGLPALLSNYDQNTTEAPSDETLQQAAAAL